MFWDFCWIVLGSHAQLRIVQGPFECVQVPASTYRYPESLLSPFPHWSQRTDWSLGRLYVAWVHHFHVRVCELFLPVCEQYPQAVQHGRGWSLQKIWCSLKFECLWERSPWIAVDVVCSWCLWIESPCCLQDDETIPEFRFCAVQTSVLLIK